MDKNMVKNTTELKNFAFAAINPYEIINAPTPIEKDSKKGFIQWGENNDYPQYIKSLYLSVATLHSIIDGTTDYICGDGVAIDDMVWKEKINDKDETIDDLVRNISKDFLIFGGFAINVVRRNDGNIAGLYYIPFERLRSDEHNNVIYYSKDWSKSTGRVKFTSYPKFDSRKKDKSSIFYFVNDRSNTYPTPQWGASIKAAEIEKNVNDYHLNSICNGFAANYMISFNNGIPNQEQADEIEANVMEKFGGSQNGGRIMINFANDKEHSIEVNKLDTDDAGEKYKSLIERTRQELFTAFRAVPNLFGLSTATGFSNEEYVQAFELYNRTAVYPKQQIIKKSLMYILDKEVSILPFKIKVEE